MPAAVPCSCGQLVRSWQRTSSDVVCGPCLPDAQEASAAEAAFMIVYCLLNVVLSAYILGMHASRKHTLPRKFLHPHPVHLHHVHRISMPAPMAKHGVLRSSAAPLGTYKVLVLAIADARSIGAAS